MFLKKLLPVAFGLALTLPTIASAGTITLSTGQSTFESSGLNQGWWATTHENTNSNDNHATGFIGPEEYRSFYTFDLRGITGKIKSASLNINRGVQTGSVELGLWDVFTSAEVVNNNVGTNNAIFNDLGSGKSYGNFVVAYSGVDFDRLNFELNLQGLNDLKSHAGFFTVGASVLGNNQNYIFGFTGGDVSYLTLEVGPADVPEPTSIALFGLAMAGLAFNRRRKV